MRIIGLTGGIASGKSTASAHLKSIGASVIDADAISHSLTDSDGETLSAIITAFGTEMLLENGGLDRRKLGLLVFGDDEARRKLNAIMHPLVLKEMQRQTLALRLQGVGRVIWDVPLLFETEMDAHTDEIWLLAVPAQVQLARLIARDGITLSQAQQRLLSQMSTDEKIKRATHTIYNTGTIEELRQSVEALWRAECEKGAGD